MILPDPFGTPGEVAMWLEREWRPLTEQTYWWLVEQMLYDFWVNEAAG
ncbi:MAG: hypothetical protein HY727_07220 [Candidatus Rokubacteria bacterium]|nr:hypothetical protein [Candidatus Rokubacteria bacterium]